VDNYDYPCAYDNARSKINTFAKAMHRPANQLFLPVGIGIGKTGILNLFGFQFFSRLHRFLCEF
jgi:hypothetical protein